MPSEGEPETEIRRRSVSDVLDASAPPLGPPLLYDEGTRRSRYVVRGLSAAVVAFLVGVIGYESFFAPKDDDQAWTPPPGLSAKDTPSWLQTLCSNRTPELCAAASRAQNPDDCPSLRAALHAVEAVERKLSARGVVSQKQHWVLVELYGQGHELCEFVHGPQPGDAK